MKFIDGVKLVRVAGCDFLVAGKAAAGRVPDVVGLSAGSARLAEALLRLADDKAAAAETGTEDEAGEFFEKLRGLGYLTEEVL